MMEFAYLRDLLEECEALLVAVFEHGLSQSGQMAHSLEVPIKRLEDAGMEYGARLLQELKQELDHSRLDFAWKSAKATVVFQALWQYVSLCSQRLEYLEAEAGLSE